MHLDDQSKRVLLHLVFLSGAFFLLLVLFFNIFLPLYTRHGEVMAVPDLTGARVQDLEKILRKTSFTYLVTDSTYLPLIPPGTVVSQTPKPRTTVKTYRMIHITINSHKPPRVSLPDLKDVSIRQARIVLMNCGLETGELIYIPDLAKNAVLKMKHNDRELMPGETVYKGMKIDLVLGDGLGDSKTVVPDLTGLTLEEAKTKLEEAFLNTGGVTYDPSKKDSPGVIYKQYPSFAAGDSVRIGTPVDLFIGGENQEKNEQVPEN